MSRAIVFEVLDDVRGLHRDLRVRIGAYEIDTDSYYLASDPRFDPEGRHPDKIIQVLRRLLEQWIAHLEAASPGDVLYLPFALWDEGSHWVRFTVLESTARLQIGWSSQEGYALAASDFASEVRTLADFKPNEDEPALELPRDAILADLRASLQALEGL